MKFDKRSKIFIAGHNGMVGTAIHKLLKKNGYKNIITISSKRLDLTNQKDVLKFFKKNKFDFVFQAAGKVGGIMSNSKYPKDFILTNTLIQTNLIDSSYITNVKRFLFIGSSCIYPKHCKQPIKEEYFMTGPLEPTNRAMATSKINGIEMCRSYNLQNSKTKYIVVMPCNLFGPKDNYHPIESHVLAALLKRMHNAKIKKKEAIEIWGTGTVKREFLYSEEFAKACFHIMTMNKKKFDKFIFDKKKDYLPIINVGSGKEISIKELLNIISKVVKYKVKFKFNSKYPDGTPRKLLDIYELQKLGFKPKQNLMREIALSYDDFLKNSV